MGGMVRFINRVWNRFIFGDFYRQIEYQKNAIRAIREFETLRANDKQDISQGLISLDLQNRGVGGFGSERESSSICWFSPQGNPKTKKIHNGHHKEV